MRYPVQPKVQRLDVSCRPNLFFSLAGKPGPNPKGFSMTRKDDPELIFCSDRCQAIANAGSVDPVKVQKWISFILTILPSLLTLFSNPSPTPTPTPTPAPVQAIPETGCIDDFFDYIEQQIEATSLSELQKCRVLATIEATAYSMLEAGK